MKEKNEYTWTIKWKLIKSIPPIYGVLFSLVVILMSISIVFFLEIFIFFFIFYFDCCFFYQRSEIYNS